MRDSEGDILESNTLGLVPAEGGSDKHKSINLLRFSTRPHLLRRAKALYRTSHQV